jgi:integrase
MSDRRSFKGLSRDAMSFVEASLADNSHRAYDAQWRSWETYAHQERMAVMPAAPEAVANWLASRALYGQAGGKRRLRGAVGHGLSVLRGAVAAVRHHHAEQGLNFDSRHPAIRLVLQGIKRKRSEPASQSPPFRPEDIEGILSTLGNANRDLRDGALIGLGFAFGLRRSEVVGLDFQKQGDGKGILRMDREVFDLQIYESKATEPVRFSPLDGAMVSSRIDQVIRAWLVALDPEPGQPLFRRVYTSGRIGEARLTDHSAARIITRLCCDLGTSMSAHGLRVGYAVARYEAGADLITVQHGLRQRSPLMAAHYARQARRHEKP